MRSFPPIKSGGGGGGGNVLAMLKGGHKKYPLFKRLGCKNFNRLEVGCKKFRTRDFPIL